MELKTLFTVFIYLSALQSQSTVRAACTISFKRDFNKTKHQPLVLTLNRPNAVDAFLVPKSGDIIALEENEVVDVACPGSSILINGNSIGAVTGQAICSSNQFIIDRRTVSFSSITCHSEVLSTAQPTKRKCLSKYDEVEIGFSVGTFIRTVLICWDKARQTTLYSQYNLTKAIAHRQTISRKDKPMFQIGTGFFTASNVQQLYAITGQRNTINKLLGLPRGSEIYVTKTGDNFLSKGHLTAKADFLYESQQNSTYYFINAIPQWQVINNGVWSNVEDDVRKLAARYGSDLIVYTGTHGVSTLPDVRTNQQIELYLYVSGIVRGIPVPRLIWKVVYNPVTKAGVAIITVNNLYVFKDFTDVICTNICNKLTWITFTQTNRAAGYTYCCDVADFRRKVNSLPNFRVTQLLV